MASLNRGGGPLYGGGSYRSREGLSARAVSGSEEIQLRIDPLHADLDEEITGLRRKVGLLKNVAQEIESEAKFQNDYLSQLQMTVAKAQAGLKNNMRRLNRTIAKHSSNHILHVVLFGLLCFCVVYLWSKHLRR
ncbi:bet1-like protein At4g14600 [Malania oleifera]|uniref:bet1-like protein At4g14600 n=1 Tax=Malania oleifera TaxID=397392 RepID=UPI0025AEBA4B|nr:bet1-like protein At4g14600 [Malania oleifera]